MPRILLLSDLYRELESNPDLRRLGEYKVVPDKGKAILPIDVKFDGKDIHLGNGDFRDGFVAFAHSTARSVDLGTSQFTELYLDSLKVENVIFADSKASRLYFDTAKIGECHFGNFQAAEMYFDTAVVGAIHGEGLKAGHIYIEGEDKPNVDQELLIDNAYRISLGVDRTTVEGSVEDATAKADIEEVAPEEEPVREITADEFSQHLREGLDLSRLGKYKVKPKEGEDSLVIHLDLEGRDLNLGSGDFTGMRVSFGSTIARTVDFSQSQFDDVSFQFARFDNCFFGDFKGGKVDFDNATVSNVFWERGTAASVNLDNLSCVQFNINSMKTDELRLGTSQIGEMYLSVGAGVQKLLCEQARIGLFNFHEGKIHEVNFGISSIDRAYLNKSTTGRINAEGLQSKVMYFGNDGKNIVGDLRVGDNAGIQHIELGRIMPTGGPEDREILKNIRLGDTEEEEEKKVPEEDPLNPPEAEIKMGEGVSLS